MSVRLDKPWRELSAEQVHRLQGQLGVYEIADIAGHTVEIGYAGGRSLFGLRGALGAQLEKRGEGGHLFRTEVNLQYTTRWRELLMAHVADHGQLPDDNRDNTLALGRLSPG